MGTSKKDPPSRDRGARMSPGVRPSSSESSGYGVRRTRSVPSSSDCKFVSSSSTVAAAASGSLYRSSSLSLSGRLVSLRSVSSSGSSVHGSRTQSFPKPTLARVKSEKTATPASQRPPALAMPASNSFKDMARTTASSKSPSTLQKSKPSPRPSPGKTAASPKASTQSSPPVVSARGGRTTHPASSSARSPVVAAKKRAEAANGGSAAAASSKARIGAPQRAMEAYVCC